MKRITTLGIIATTFLLSLNLACAQASVGVKAGDWIKYELTVSGATPPDMPQWVKAECTSVAGTTVTLKMTMYMNNGTEHTETWTIDVVSGSGNAVFQIIIPANSKTGDIIKLVNNGDLAIAGEATGTYAGASRTIVYATVTKEDGQYTYRWDKQTGILLEITVTQGSTSLTFEAATTNIWQSPTSPLSSFNLPLELICLGASVAIAIAIITVAIFYNMRKKGNG